MKRQTLFITGILLVGLLLAPTVAFAAEDPRFETSVPEPTLAPGETTQLAVEFTNDAEDLDDEVETATDVKATLKEGSSPITVLSGTHRLGTLQDGQPVVDQFSLRVPQNVDAGTYRLPIELEYVYEEDEQETTTVYAEVRIEERATFSVQGVTEDLTVGEDGSVSLTLENTGSENVTDAAVRLTSETGNVLFGTSPSTVAYVGEWDAGETRSVTVDAQSPPDANSGSYSITAAVEYENSDGFERTAAPKNVGVTVAPETDQFSLNDVEHSLRVGEEGTLSMTVQNGDERITDAVVRLSQPGSNIHPLASEYSIGAMEPDSSAAVSFPIEVSESAEPTPRQFSFTIAYENAEGDDHVSDPLNVQATIEPERDRFDINPKNVTVEAGGSGTVTLEVTNNGDSAIEDVNAKIFTNDPLGSGDDEAYIQSLEPGDSTEIAFGVSASGAAIEKQYPISMDFRYDTNGDTKLSKTYQVPISVTEPDSSGPSPILIGGIVVLVIVIGGYLLYRRR